MPSHLMIFRIDFVHANSANDFFITLKFPLLLVKHVRSALGPVASPEAIYFVNDVPKTRSGKIMRRVIKAKALGNPTGDISALANPDAVEAIPLIK